MTMSHLVNSVTDTDVIVYTSSLRCEGRIRTNNRRLSDFLNHYAEEFVIIHDAHVEPLYLSYGAPPTKLQFAQIRLDTVICVLPVDPGTEQDRPLESRALKLTKVTHDVNLEAAPFAVRGSIHVGDGVEVKEHLRDPFSPFVPVTGATVIYVPNRQRNFQAPVLLVHKVNLQALLVREARPAEPEVRRPTTRRLPLKAGNALVMLRRCPLFAGAEAAGLEALLDDLLRQTYLDAKDYDADTTIFEQGDLGETLYLIDRGRVEILREVSETEPPVRVAISGPGDFFGEMAILGDKQRTATIRTLEPTRVLAIHETGLKMILSRFPSIAGQLLKIMVERRGALPKRAGEAAEPSRSVSVA